MKTRWGMLIGSLAYLAIIYPLPRPHRFILHAALTIAMVVALSRIWTRVAALEQEAKDTRRRLKEIDAVASQALDAVRDRDTIRL